MVTPLALLAPTPRLVCALLVGSALLVADPTRGKGAALALGLLCLWLGLARIQARHLVHLLGVGVLLFLGTWGTTALAGGGEGLGHAWTLAFRSLATAALAGTTLRTFRLGSLLRATAGLPGAPLREQIAHQTLGLMEESRRILQAWVLRGAARRIALVPATPRVWLPRVARRAERVSAAMDLRGIPSHGLFWEQQPFTTRDAAALVLALGALVGSLVLRWGLA